MDSSLGAAAFSFIPGTNPATSGLLVGNIGSNRIAGAASRDLTNTGWAKTNVSAARNASGIDGITSSASTITGSANSGVVSYATTLTAGTTRSPLLWIKRAIGSGTLEARFGDVSSASWVDITAAIDAGSSSSNGFVPVRLPASIAANPVLELRIGTSGDAFKIDVTNITDTTFQAWPILNASYNQKANDALTATLTSSTSALTRYGFRAKVRPSGDSTNIGLKNSSNQYLAINIVGSTAALNPNKIRVIGNNGSIFLNVSLDPPSGYVYGQEAEWGIEFGYAGEIIFLFNGMPFYTLGTSTSVLTRSDPVLDRLWFDGTGATIRDVKVFTRPVVNVVTLGDSITADGKNKDTIIKKRKELYGKLDLNVVNRGISSTGISDWLAANNAWVANQVQTAYQPTAQKNILFVRLGTNTIANGSNSMSQSKTDMKTLLQQIVAAQPNWKIILSTFINRQAGLSNGVTTASFRTRADDLGSYIKQLADPSNPEYIPGVIGVSDEAAISTLQGAENILPANMSVDGIHLNQAGYDELSANDARAISQFIDDATPPTFSSVSSSSNNSLSSSKGKSGDILTTTFTTSETLQASPTVTLGGQAMTFSGKTGLNYTYTRALTGAETEGSAAISISGLDLAGNASTGSGTFATDFTAPVVSSISISSNNETNSAHAKSGNVVTTAFTVAGSPTSVTAAMASAKVMACINTSGTSWSCARTLDGTETAGTNSISIAAMDSASNVGIGTSGITVDFTTPTLSSIATVSDNSISNTRARSGNVVTTTFTTSKALNADPTVTVGGQSMAFGSLSGSTYTYTRNVNGSETEGTATVNISGTDTTGNAVTNTSSIATDFTNPVFSSITVQSDNSLDPNVAINGNVVTLAFATSETLNGNPLVTLGGQAMAFTAKTGGYYSYSRTLTATETEGTAVIAISGSDTSGNVGTGLGSFATDFTAPSAPLIITPASPVTINSNSYAISGTAEANSLVTIYGGGSSVGSQQLAGGATAFSLSVPLVQSAVNSFSAKARDAGGNLSSATNAPAIIKAAASIATPNPTPSPTTSPASSATPAASPAATPLRALIANASTKDGVIQVSLRPTFSGTAPAGSKVTVTVHSDPLNCTSAAGNDGKWNCTLDKDLPAGRHTVDVMAVTTDGQSISLASFPIDASSGLAQTGDATRALSLLGLAILLANGGELIRRRYFIKNAI